MHSARPLFYCLILFLAIPTASANEAALERLALPLPEGWKTAVQPFEGREGWQLVPAQPRPGCHLTLSPTLEVGEQSAELFVGRMIQSVFSALGGELEGASPAQAGTNGNGIPYVFQGARGKAQDGGMVFLGVVAFEVAAGQVQALTVVARSPTDFEQTMSALAPAMEAARRIHRVRHHRLLLDLPETWQVASRTDDELALQPFSDDDQLQVLVTKALPLGDQTFRRTFEEAIQQTLQGSTVKARSPIATGHIEQGFGLLQAGVRSEEGGNERFTAYFGISAGNHCQLIVASALTEEGFQRLAAAASPVVMEAEVLFPKLIRPEAIGTDWQQHRFVHMAWAVPPSWKQDDESSYGAYRFQIDVPVSGGRMYPIRVRLDLQPWIPAHTTFTLERWLLMADFGLERSPKAELKTAYERDCRVTTGLQYSQLKLWEQGSGGWVTERAAVGIIGPGWTLLVGGGIGQNEEWKALAMPDRQLVIAAWNNAVVPQLVTVGLTMTWSDPPVESAEARGWLIERERYRYEWERSVTTGSISGYWEGHAYWDFYPDGTCKIEKDTWFGYNITEDYTIPVAGVEPISGNPILITGYTAVGSSDSPEERNKGRFTVITHEGIELIQVIHNNGLATYHLLERSKTGSFWASEGFTGLAIDGQIEGKYSSGSNDFSDWGLREEWKE